MSEIKLDKTQAVAILVALINEGKIELPCLKAFNKFREWELSKARPDAVQIERAQDISLLESRTKAGQQAASLDAEYLKTFLSVLTSKTDDKQLSLDAWDFINNLRLIREKVEAKSLEQKQK